MKRENRRLEERGQELLLLHMGLEGGPRGAKNQIFLDSNVFCATNFTDKARETVSRDKPRKRVFASHDIAKECVFNVLVL